MNILYQLCYVNRFNCQLVDTGTMQMNSTWLFAPIRWYNLMYYFNSK